MRSSEEIAREIVDSNYGLDFERGLAEAIAQAIRAERERVLPSKALFSIALIDMPDDLDAQDGAMWAYDWLQGNMVQAPSDSKEGK